MNFLDSGGKRRAVLASLGGILLTGSLALDDVAPDYVGLAVVIPIFLGFGVLEIYNQYHDYYDTAGRAGVILSTIGLGFLLLAILLYAVMPAGLLLVVVVAVPGAAGLFALAVGSALLGLTLYRLDVLHGVTAVLLTLGIPLTPLVGGLLASITGSVLPAGIGPGFSATPYGIAWALTGYRLWKTAGQASVPTPIKQEQSISLSPQLVCAAIIGVLYVVVSIGRFAPLGILSGTPWVNRSFVLDIGHLVIGTTGIGIALSQRADYAQTFNRAVGTLLLVLVVLTFIRIFQDVRWLTWLIARQLDLNMPDALLHLPTGIVLVAVGFGVSDS